MNRCINKNSKVTLHFALKLVSGEIVDTTRDKQPASFIMGDGSLLPGFEQVLIGLKAGDRQEFNIAPEQGFGQPNPQNQQTVIRSQFSGIALQEGLMVMFHDAAKKELPGVIVRFDDQQVVVDFNHPLAGKNLLFDVEIISIDEVV